MQKEKEKKGGGLGNKIWDGCNGTIKLNEGIRKFQ
jgi:hypothetical protein